MSRGRAHGSDPEWPARVRAEPPSTLLSWVWPQESPDTSPFLLQSVCRGDMWGTLEQRDLSQVLTAEHTLAGRGWDSCQDGDRLADKGEAGGWGQVPLSREGGGSGEEVWESGGTKAGLVCVAS